PSDGNKAKALCLASSNAARNSSLSVSDGRAPFQRRAQTSSNVAFSASSSTGWPTMTRRPFSPSTSLSAVSAATTSSSPLAVGEVTRPESLAYRSHSSKAAAWKDQKSFSLKRCFGHVRDSAPTRGDEVVDDDRSRPAAPGLFHGRFDLLQTFRR